MRKEKLDEVAETIDELRLIKDRLGKLYASISAVDSGYAGTKIPNEINYMVTTLTTFTNGLVDEYDGLSSHLTLNSSGS